MTDLFFGGSYEAVLRLIKLPKFAMFGEEDDTSIGLQVEKVGITLNIGEDR